MRHLARLFPVLLSLAACDTITGCDKRTEVHELVSTDPDYVENYRRYLQRVNDGWACEKEPIRNAFGAVIGNRYTCTTCD